MTLAQAFPIHPFLHAPELQQRMDACAGSIDDVLKQMKPEMPAAVQVAGTEKQLKWANRRDYLYLLAAINATFPYQR